MKTNINITINTVEEAKAFLTELYNNGESYHPEDDANELVGDPFTKEEGLKLNELMESIYNLKGNDGRHSDPMIFDPCEYLMDLDGHIFINGDVYRLDQDEAITIGLNMKNKKIVCCGIIKRTVEGEYYFDCKGVDILIEEKSLTDYYLNCAENMKVLKAKIKAA